MDPKKLPFALGVALLVGLIKPSDIGMRTAPVSAYVAITVLYVLGAWFTLRSGPIQRQPWLAALVNLSVFPISGGLMPYIAREVFLLDQRGLGWLVASFASGALLGSVSLRAIGPRLHPARTMLLAVPCGT